MNENENFLIWHRFLEAIGSDKCETITVVRDGLEMVFPKEAIKWGTNDLCEQRSLAQKKVEDLIAVIKDIQENGAVYDVQSLIDGLPWDRG